MDYTAKRHLDVINTTGDGLGRAIYSVVSVWVWPNDSVLVYNVQKVTEKNVAIFTFNHDPF